MRHSAPTTAPTPEAETYADGQVSHRVAPPAPPTFQTLTSQPHSPDSRATTFRLGGHRNRAVTLRPSRHDNFELQRTAARPRRHHPTRQGDPRGRAPSGRPGGDPTPRTLPELLHSLRAPAVIVQLLLVAWVPFGVLSILFGLMQRSLLHRVATNPAGVRLAEVVADQDRVDAGQRNLQSSAPRNGRRVPGVVLACLSEPRRLRPPPPVRHGMGDRRLVRAVPEPRPSEAGGRRHLGVGERVQVRRAWVSREVRSSSPPGGARSSLRSAWACSPRRLRGPHHRRSAHDQRLLSPAAVFIVAAILAVFVVRAITRAPRPPSSTQLGSCRDRAGTPLP